MQTDRIVLRVRQGRPCIYTMNKIRPKTEPREHCRYELSSTWLSHGGRILGSSSQIELEPPEADAINAEDGLQP